MIFVFPKEHHHTMNINVAFQNEMPLPKGTYDLEIAARNAYRIYANDTFTHYGPSRSAHGYLQVDKIKLQLQNQENFITVEVVGHNINSYYFVDEPPLFAAKLSKEQLPILSTNHFECYLLDDRIRKIQRYSFQRDFAESYKKSKDRSFFYLGHKNMFPKLETEAVKSPKLINRQTPYPVFQMYEPMHKVEEGTFQLDTQKPIWTDRAIDNISNTYKGYKREDLDVYLTDDISRFVYLKQNLTSSKTLTNQTYFIYDAYRTLTGFTQIKVQVLKKTILHLIFDEVDYQESSNKNTNGIHIDFSRNDCSNVIRYDLEPGNYKLLSFEPYSLRFLNVMVETGELMINDIHVIKYENHEMYNLKLKSKDEDINIIVEAAQHTLAQNAVDVLTDCPSRERAGWLCDAWFSGRAERLMSGHNLIERNFLYNYATSPQSSFLPEGMIPMNYPADHPDGIYIPNWALWYGIELYDYYKRTNDEELILASKSKIEGLIRYFKAYENEIGLIENLKSWVFIEWSKANDFIEGVNIPSNMIYAYFLECVGLLYREETYITKAEHIRETIKNTSFDGKFFVDQLIRDKKNNLNMTKNISETCQYYAFFTNTATEISHQHLYKVLVNEFGFERDQKKTHTNIHQSNAFIGNYLRLELLRKNKHYKQLFKECKMYFLYMAKRTGTLWEHSQVYGSLNHGFASYAANLIIESLTGIESIDQKNKTIYYKKSPMTTLDFNIELPIAGGLKVKQNNQVIEFELPKGYQMIEI
jgi:alpha-L-rhamnosidase